MGSWLQHDWHQLHCGWPQPVTSWLVYVGYITADSSWLLHRWPQSQQPGVWWETGQILRCSQAVMRLAAAEVREDSRSLVAVSITVLWYFLCNTNTFSAQLQESNAGRLVFVFSPLPALSLVAQHLCFLLQKWNTDWLFSFRIPPPPHHPPHPFFCLFVIFSIFLCNISIWCLQFGRTLDYNTLLSSL